MADERNVAHDKKVTAEKAKAGGGGVGKDEVAHADGDGMYTTEPHKKHPTRPGKKASEGDDAAGNEWPSIAWTAVRSTSWTCG